MKIYRCTIHLDGSSVTSAWNTEKYWAKQQAANEAVRYADALIRELKK